MSLPEVLLWQQLRRRKLNGLSFRRQHPIGPYILDFYCAIARLAVEIDGLGHEGRVAYDTRRDSWLADRGIRVLRIPAANILRDESVEYALADIIRAASPSTAFGGPPPPLRGGGS